MKSFALGLVSAGVLTGESGFDGHLLNYHKVIDSSQEESGLNLIEDLSNAVLVVFHEGIAEGVGEVGGQLDFKVKLVVSGGEIAWLSESVLGVDEGIGVFFNHVAIFPKRGLSPGVQKERIAGGDLDEVSSFGEGEMLDQLDPFPSFEGDLDGVIHDGGVEE